MAKENVPVPAQRSCHHCTIWNTDNSDHANMSFNRTVISNTIDTFMLFYAIQENIAIPTGTSNLPQQCPTSDTMR